MYVFWSLLSFLYRLGSIWTRLLVIQLSRERDSQHLLNFLVTYPVIREAFILKNHFFCDKCQIVNFV